MATRWSLAGVLWQGTQPACHKGHSPLACSAPVKLGGLGLSELVLSATLKSCLELGLIPGASLSFRFFICETLVPSYCIADGQAK